MDFGRIHLQVSSMLLEAGGRGGGDGGGGGVGVGGRSRLVCLQRHWEYTHVHASMDLVLD